MGRYGIGSGRPRGLRAASASAASYGAIPPTGNSSRSTGGHDAATPDVETAAGAAPAGAASAATAEAAASAPTVSASQTLWFVAPWLVPRTFRLCMFAVASLVLTLCSKVCIFVGPLLLRATVDGLADTLRVGPAGGEGTLPPPPTPTASVGGWVLSPVVAVVLYAFARLGTNIFSQAQRVTWQVISLATTRHFSVVTFAHLHSLSLSWHLLRRTGEVLRVMDRGVSSLATLLSLVSSNLLPTALELCLVVGVFFHLRSPAIAVVTVFTVVAYTAYSVAITSWRLRFRRAVNDADNRVSDAAVDSLLNYETVKSFGAEAGEVLRYAHLLRRYQHESFLSASSLAALNGGQAAILNVGLATTLGLATVRVAAGDLSVGDLVAINAYVLQLFAPLAWLGMAWRSLQTAATDLERLVALHMVQPLVRDVPGAPPLRVKGGAVVFDNVSFTYPSRAAGKGAGSSAAAATTTAVAKASPANGADAVVGEGQDASRAMVASPPSEAGIYNVSFSVPPGGTLGVVGASGSGKTTLLRLLMRFYNVDGGCITIDGQNVAHVTQSSLRQAVGVVAQDTVLLNDTLRFNLAYGRLGAPPAGTAANGSTDATAAAVDAAEAASAADLSSLPSVPDADIAAAVEVAQLGAFVAAAPAGLDTLVGERGLRLSGGERQRVGIARVVLRSPSLLLLDEASSSLDSETEAAMQAALRRVAAGRTTIMVAHRLSTVAHAQEILVMEAGRVVERGTHEALVGREGGVYARLWALQSTNRDQGAGEEEEAGERQGEDLGGDKGGAKAANMVGSNDGG